MPLFASRPPFSLRANITTDVNRWLDVSAPYLGFGRRRKANCIERTDVIPRLGEAGLGLMFPIPTEIQSPAWGVSWLVIKPDNSNHWLNGFIENGYARIITDNTIFTLPGAYEIQAYLFNGSRLWPQTPVIVACDF